MTKDKDLEAAALALVNQLNLDTDFYSHHNLQGIVKTAFKAGAEWARGHNKPKLSVGERNKLLNQSRGIHSMFDDEDEV